MSFDEKGCILIRSNILICFLLEFVFLNSNFKFFTNSKSLRVSPIFFPRNFMFYLTFRSLTQFDSTFYTMWDKVILIMMMMMVIMIMITNKGSIGTSCSNTNYQKECLFHHQIALESLWKAYMCESISWLFCSIDQFVYIYADTTLFWLWHHYYNSCNKVVKVFQNVSLLKIVWTILSPLDFLM